MFNFIKKQRRAVVNHEGVIESVNNEISQLKRNYIEDILKSKKLPVVLLDTSWHTAKQHIQSPIIDQIEKKLQELLKEQGRLNTDYKEYTAIKQNFLKEILVLSNKAQEGDNKALEELNKMHQSTLGANQKIEEIEARLEAIDDEINSKNKEIVSEMIAIGYGFIDTYKQKNEALETEITELRLQLLQKTQQKKESEAFLKDIYNYLHNIVGREQIEVIDKALGDKK